MLFIIKSFFIFFQEILRNLAIMNFRSGVLLLFTLSLTFLIVSSNERYKRNGAMHHKVSKSGERIRFTQESRDTVYITCASPTFKCCKGSLGLVSSIISNKCEMKDHTPGICCSTDGLAEAEVIFENGTHAKVFLPGTPEEEKIKFDTVAANKPMDEINRF